MPDRIPEDVPSAGPENEESHTYTRGGDFGQTDVPAIGRVTKDSPRPAACGTVDELNCMLGELRARIAVSSIIDSEKRFFDERLQATQGDLFTIGALVSGAISAGERWKEHLDSAVELYESEINATEAELPSLRNFIVPGEDLTSSAAHLARAVCRRAERCCLAALQDDPSLELVIPFLNRLSDWLYIMARRLARLSGHADRLWDLGKSSAARGANE